MKVIQISDEVYDRLKNSIVDPFDDTPESVISRLIDIVDKAKNRGASWDDPAESPVEAAVPQEGRTKKGRSWNKQADTVL